MKDAKGHGSDPRGAHSTGVNEIGRPSLPPPPGTAPIPPGNVRLYHQTSEANLAAIERNGLSIENARGIEGPKAIYADEKGFYGDPKDKPTIEFSVPKERWDAPFVRADSVKDNGQVAPKDIIAAHYPWHQTARYIESNPKVLKAVLAGEHDDLQNDDYYKHAIQYIKQRHG